MLKKNRILITISLISLCVFALSFGIYAAKQLSMSTGGSVLFDPSSCIVEINGNISGTANPVNSYSATSHGQKELTPWAIGNLEFDRTQNNKIIITFEVKNLSEHKIIPIITNLPTNSYIKIKISNNGLAIGIDEEGTLSLEIELISTTSTINLSSSILLTIHKA